MRLLVFFSSEEVGTTHRNSLRVLAETGVLVEHEGMLGRLEALGGQWTQPEPFSPLIWLWRITSCFLYVDSVGEGRVDAHPDNGTSDGQQTGDVEGADPADLLGEPGRQ
jgi:hypothetical protein